MQEGILADPHGWLFSVYMYVYMHPAENVYKCMYVLYICMYVCMYICMYVCICMWVGIHNIKIFLLVSAEHRMSFGDLEQGRSRGITSYIAINSALLRASIRQYLTSRTKLKIDYHSI